MQLVLIVSLISCYCTRYVKGVTTESSENAVVKVINLIAEVNVMKRNYNELLKRVMNNEIEIVDMKNQEKYWKNEVEFIKRYMTCQIEELNDINTENNDNLNETKAALMKAMISFSQSLALMNETIQELRHSLPEKVRCEDNLTERISTLASVTSCSSSPCDNSGSCLNANGSFVCVCPKGYSGKRCEVTPCLNNPCLHNGTCSVGSSTFSCRCHMGYSGESCEVTPCSSSPCQNSGTCFSIDGTYACACQRGYSGTQCEVTPCSGNFCLNQGTCSIINSNFRCTCKSGFSGRLCEVTPCSSTPCRLGKCSVSGSSYTCSCPYGFDVSRCEGLKKIISSPCYPSNYANDQTRSWTVIVESGFKVKIKFTFFKTELSYDFVKVYDGRSATNILGSYSGASIPPELKSTNRYMHITFTSDSSSTLPGFQANIYYFI
ncbi:delta-like protein 4 [Mytilus trossulus]|uniref:delta-like protein 4 n=1 Tax=Mytilus trossulus TaxID=6551 RepID=UPI0030060C18